MAVNTNEIFEAFQHRVLRLSMFTGAPDKKEFIGNGFIAYLNSGICLVFTCEHSLIKQDKPNENKLDEDVKYWVDFSDQLNPGFEATVFHTDSERDLALLRADNVQLQYAAVPFYNADPIRVGDDVVMVAFYEMKDAVLAEPGTMRGKIVGVPDTSNSKRLLIRANYTSTTGTSGAPVILAKPMLVAGVQSEGEDAAKYAVSIQSIQEALRDWIQHDHENVPTDMLDAPVQDLLETLVTGWNVEDENPNDA